MRKLKSLWLVSVVLLLVSCSMSAKSDKSSEAGTASKGEVVTLNKAEFLQKVFNYEKNATKWVYEGDKPCIIDIVVYKVNVDKEKELAAAFGIQSIPTFLFIPKEGQPQISMGALPREEFVKQIDTFLLKKK